jgi:hypothetical protein
VLKKFCTTLSASFIFLSIAYSGVLAQVRRYPEPAEALNAIQETWLPNMSERLSWQAYRDQRTPDNIDEIQAFIDAWEPFYLEDGATFLGEWHGSYNGNELIVSIYPSNKPGGQVCIIQYEEAHDIYRFATGYVKLDPFRIEATGTTEGSDSLSLYLSIFQLGDVVDEYREHLVQVSILSDTNEPVVGGHTAFPRRLRDPSSLPGFAQRERQNSQLIWNFYTEPGCTSEFPEPRSGPRPNRYLRSEGTVGNVMFRFRDAHVSNSPTATSFEAFWEIDNQSSDMFSFFARNVVIENAQGQAISCREQEAWSQVYDAGERPEDSIGSEPFRCARLVIDDGYSSSVGVGELITGRIIIVQDPDAVDGLYLRLPEATPPGIEPRILRVPIELGEPLTD